MSLLGINRNDGEYFIAYNPVTTTQVNTKDGGYLVQKNSFAVGTNPTTDGTDPVLATAHFKELHIGGGYEASDTGLTIDEFGNIKTHGTLTQSSDAGRLAAPVQRTMKVVSDIYYTSDDIGKVVVSTNAFRNR